MRTSLTQRVIHGVHQVLLQLVRKVERQKRTVSIQDTTPDASRPRSSRTRKQTSTIRPTPLLDSLMRSPTRRTSGRCIYCTSTIISDSVRGDFVDLKLTEENRQILTMMNFKKGPTDTAEVLVYLLDHVVLLVRKKTVNKKEELHVCRKPIPLELLVVAEIDQAIPRLGIAKRLLSATNLLRENQAFPIMFRHLGRG